MSKFRRSWALLKCSVCVIGRNKKLLIFPILVMLLTCMAMLLFALPIVLWGTGHPYSDAAHWQAVGHRWADWNNHGGQFSLTLHPAGYALMAAVYLFSTFLATFFNVAFYSQILNALGGRPVSILEGLRTACSRIKSIIIWSLFTGLVGLAIRSLEERVGVVGRWVVGLLGIAWSVASVFVVPAIILEPETANPLRYLKTSASLLKRTWGESLIGFVGFQFGGLLIFIGSLVFLGIGCALSVMLHTLLFIAVISVLWLFGLISLLYLLSVAGQVFIGAIYLYAAKGVVTAPFNEEQMHTAWKQKKQRPPKE